MSGLWVILALVAPDPVENVAWDRDEEGTVHLEWDLPADPEVEGVVIFRYCFYHDEEDTFEITGLPTSFTDTTADPWCSYSYSIHTKNGTGDLSDPVIVYVEAVEHRHHHLSHFDCYASAGGGAFPAGLLLAGIVLLAGIRRRVSGPAPR